jgi:DnaJ-class molecular chaperone
MISASTETTCEKCGGTGHVSAYDGGWNEWEERCDECNGTGEAPARDDAQLHPVFAQILRAVQP